MRNILINFTLQTQVDKIGIATNLSHREVVGREGKRCSSFA